MRKVLCFTTLALVAVAMACSAGNGGTRQGLIVETWPTKTPTSVPANDEEAVRQIINTEGEALMKLDVDRLAGIWAKDGVVIDLETEGGRTFRGWKAILDRYENIVFPTVTHMPKHPNIRVTIEGARAVAVSDTKIGSTDLKDNDRWTLKKIDGRWQITSLTFGLSSRI